MSTQERRPFRAADVLTGRIDERRVPAGTGRPRKQISAQLEPAQVRLLGELHARLNAAARTRIEKSELVGLGIELLAAALNAADREFAPAPGGSSRRPVSGTESEGVAFADAAELRAYVRSCVRAYELAADGAPTPVRAARGRNGVAGQK
jgi:hypothetical protein